MNIKESLKDFWAGFTYALPSMLILIGTIVFGMTVIYYFEIIGVIILALVFLIGTGIVSITEYGRKIREQQERGVSPPSNAQANLDNQ